MKRKFSRRGFRFAALLSLGGAFAGATAAAQDITPPESYQVIDRNGVSLATGTLIASTVEIGIGQKGAGGLFYSATYDQSVQGWRHSTWGGVHREPEDPYAILPSYTVTVMGQSVVFEKLGAGRYQSVDGYGALSEAGGVFTFTALDGTIATFSQPSRAGYMANLGVIQEIIRPNGERITFTYASSGSGPTVSRWPISVSNNLGYQLHFEYLGHFKNDFTVTALNNGVDACALAATTCAFSRAWPALTFASPSSSLRTVTDELGRTQRLGFNSSRLTGIARPTQATGWNVQTAWVSPGSAKVTSVTDGGGTWAYDVSPRSVTQTTTATVTDPNNNVTQYHFSWQVPDAGPPLPRLQWIKDGLNRTTYIVQDGGGLRRAIYPEGDKIEVFRNERGDVETITRSAKPGSSLPDLVTTATYGDCSTPIMCGRPTATTDALGNVTNYTYDAAGNLLTETGPAPAPGAPRPQTRYVWEQRYAWYKQNGSSAITQAATPVWVQVSQSQCMTGATC